MAQMRLFKFLSSLDEEEWTSFGKFLQSPYFTQKKEPYELIRLVRSQKSFPNLTAADEARCIRSLWKQAAEDAGVRARWLRLLSDTSLLLERFWAVEKLLRSPIERQLYTAERLLEKREQEALQVSLSKLDSQLQEEAVDQQHCHVSWRRWVIYYSSPLFMKYNLQTDGEQGIQQVLEQKIFEEYCLKLLIVRTNMGSIKPLMVAEPAGIMLSNEQLLAASEVFDAASYPLHYFYRQFLQLAESGSNPEALERISGELSQQQQRISPQELIQLCMLGHNASFTLRKYAGECDYAGIMKRFSNLAITAAGQMKNDSISDTVYSHLCIPLLSTKDEAQYLQVKKAIAPRLERSVADAAINLMDAYYHFLFGRFDKALQPLSQINNNAIDYAVRVQSLRLRIHFEKFIENPLEDEPLLRRLESYRKFLNRRASQLLSPERRLEYVNLHDLLRLAMGILLSGKNQHRDFLQLLEEAKRRPTPVQQWMLEKLQYLADRSAS